MYFVKNNERILQVNELTSILTMQSMMVETCVRYFLALVGCIKVCLPVATVNHHVDDYTRTSIDRGRPDCLTSFERNSIFHLHLFDSSRTVSEGECFSTSVATKPFADILNGLKMRSRLSYI